MGLIVEFLNSGRSPQCQPNPSYPAGIDVDMSFGAEHTCTAKLPYPAPRCGTMVVRCSACGNSVWLTVAGRQDDPRTVKLGCHGGLAQAQGAKEPDR
jgi:hypothetical protein